MISSTLQTAVKNCFNLCRFDVDMDEMVLPVTYGGEDIELPLTMYAYGYTFRVEVLIGETPVIFEPDEEGSYRALVNADQVEKNKKLNRGLLQAIAVALEKLR
jgi:hypothetical protein